MMAAARILDMMMITNRLKTTPRTGWAVRGVPAPESVADHTTGVALAAMLLSDLVAEDLDREKILTMAILHDLAESETGDLSLGGSRLLPTGAKAAMEEKAMAELLADMGFADRWLAVWEEFEALGSLEARLVRDADRVDLLLQALTYERTTGTVNLDDFWQFAPVTSFHFAESRALVQEMLKRRPRGDQDLSA